MRRGWANGRALLMLGLPCLVLTSACQSKQSDQAAEIANLKQQIHQLQADHSAQESEVAAERERAKPKYELLVTKGATKFTQTYTSSEMCENARQAIFAEDQRMASEAQSQIGKPNAAGVTEIYSSPPAKSSAVCLPI